MSQRISRACTVFGAVVFALISALPAQAPSRSKPTFVLAAGEHRIDAFCDLTGQIRKAAVDIDRSLLADVLDERLDIQRDLMLPVEAWEDVATSILMTRGLLLVPSDRAGRLRLLSFRKSLDLDDGCVLRTARQLLARPRRIELVSVEVATGDADHRPFIHALRPFFMFEHTTLEIDSVEQAVRLTGTTSTVVPALRLLHVLLDRPVPDDPPVRFQGQAELTWPGGEMSAPAFVSLAARTLDANVVGKVSDVELKLGEAAELTATDWYARASHALRLAGQILVPIVPEQRVFLLAPVKSVERQWMALSRYESPDTVALSKDVTPVMTVMTVAPEDMRRAQGLLRPQFARRSPGLTVGSVGRDKLILLGLRSDVAEAVAMIRAQAGGR
jgi:hypothetical protein